MTELNSYTVTSNETINLSAVFFYHISIQMISKFSTNWSRIQTLVWWNKRKTFVVKMQHAVEFQEK